MLVWLWPKLSETNHDADALRIMGTTPPPGELAELWTFTRAFSLYRLENLNVALPLFKQLLSDKKMRAPANFFVANCYSGMAQYQTALRYYDAAIQFGQSSDNKALNVYYYNYGLTLYKLGKYQTSRDTFLKSIQRLRMILYPGTTWGDAKHSLAILKEHETHLRRRLVRIALLTRRTIGWLDSMPNTVTRRKRRSITAKSRMNCSGSWQKASGSNSVEGPQHRRFTQRVIQPILTEVSADIFRRGGESRNA